MSEEMRQHTWTEECPTKIDDLRLLRMLHWTDKGSVQWGEIVLTNRVALRRHLSRFVFTTISDSFFKTSHRVSWQ